MPDVSIVAGTCRRAAGLERLLTSIHNLRTSIPHEVIIVNNAPGCEIPCKSKFPGVRWMEEGRKGASYARNTGIRAASAPVIAILDDDDEVPPHWLDAIAGPVLRGRCDAATGPSIPLKVETEAESIFETYAKRIPDAKPAEFDRAWLRRHFFHLPVWRLGGFGNSAFRRSVFDDPRVGMIDALLGPGSPADAAEDQYYFYRLLRAGYRLRYEPSAHVFHSHRESMAELEAQLCGYRRGEVCFCLLAAGRHRDPRALAHLLLWIPAWRAGLIVRESLCRIRGERRISFRLMLREIGAYFSGPAALRASYRQRKEAAKLLD